MSTVEIRLTRGMVALVDEEDAARVLARGPWAAQVGAGTYARNVKYLGGGAANPVKSSILMHSLITGWPYVDHINGDGLDNRRRNLREATHALNMRNKRLYRNNTSGFKGVFRNTEKGRAWGARIRLDGRTRRLGNYDTPEDAARAYDAAARKLFGEFGAFNFPLPGERAA